MRERDQRLKAIKRIIRTNKTDSQETLLQLLQKEGLSSTQATLSRDLKSLKVSKVSEGSHGYYYSLPSEEEIKESEKSYIQDFLRGYVSIDFSGNLGVVKTLPGHAGSVALAIDCLGFEDILGTLAGDDTVLLILREGISSDAFFGVLQQKIPEIEEI